MKMLVTISFMLLLSANLFADEIIITSPEESYKPLPQEKITISVETEVLPYSLYYRTDIENEWQVIADELFTLSYQFTCPKYFFDYIEFRAQVGEQDGFYRIYERKLELTEPFNYCEISKNTGIMGIAYGYDSLTFSRDNYAGDWFQNTNIKSHRVKFDKDGNKLYFLQGNVADESQDYYLILDDGIESSNPIDTLIIIPEESNDNGDDEYFDGADFDLDDKGNIVLVPVKRKQIAYYDREKDEGLYKVTYDDVSGDAHRYVCVAISPDGERIYGGLSNGDIVVLDKNLNLLHTIRDAHGQNGNMEVIWTIDVKDDFLASAGVSGKIKIWDTQTYKQLGEISHGGQVRMLKFHETKPYLLSASFDKTVVEWNYMTQEKLDEMFHGFQILCATYSGTGDSVFVCGRSDSLVVWKRPEMEFFADTLVNVSDYAAKIYIDDVKGQPADRKISKLKIKVDDRLKGLDYPLDINFSVKLPKQTAFIAEFDKEDTLDYSISGVLENQDIQRFYYQILRTENKVDSAEICNYNLKQPIGAKILYDDGLVEVTEACYGYTPIVFKDTYYTVRTIENIIRVDFYSDNQSEGESVNVNLFTSDGTLLETKQYVLSFGVNTFDFDCSTFGNGFYQVIIDDKNGVYSEKIILLR